VYNEDKQGPWEKEPEMQQTSPALKWHFQTPSAKIRTIF